MSAKLTAPLAESLILGDGFKVRFAAVDPTTGANVTGVKVTNVNLDGDTHGRSVALPPGGFKLETGPYMLVGGPSA